MGIWGSIKGWNAWATSYRNARALGAAVVMLLAILSMLSLRCNPVVHKSSVVGLVLEIEATNLREMTPAEPHSRVLVATPDSQEIRILLPPPVPRTGDFLPLLAERHKKGDTDYFLDAEKWRTEGPQ